MVRVVTIVKIVVMKRSVRPVVDKLRWAHVHEDEDDETFGVPERQVFEARKYGSHGGCYKGVKKDVVLPASSRHVAMSTLACSLQAAEQAANPSMQSRRTSLDITLLMSRLHDTDYKYICNLEQLPSGQTPGPSIREHKQCHNLWPQSSQVWWLRLYTYQLLSRSTCSKLVPLVCIRYLAASACDLDAVIHS